MSKDLLVHARTRTRTHTHTQVFIAMAKALDFIDPDKLSMTVVMKLFMAALSSRPWH